MPPIRTRAHSNNAPIAFRSPPARSGPQLRIGGIFDPGPDPFLGMQLIESMKVTAARLREAARMAEDWRVRNALADAGTLIECALFIQQKITAGRMPIEPQAPGVPGPKYGRD